MRFLVLLWLVSTLIGGVVGYRTAKHDHIIESFIGSFVGAVVYLLLMIIGFLIHFVIFFS